MLAFGLLPSGCGWVPTFVNQGIDAATTLAEHRSLYTVAEDYSIRQEITGRFLDENLVIDVNTDVYKGQVMLTGSVKNTAARKRAEDLARQAAAVRQVFNDIQIIDDNRAVSVATGLLVEAKLKAKLLTADGIRSINYRWRATNGVVYLLGTADTPDEFSRVIAIVRGTDGVRTVVSHVTPIGFNERSVVSSLRNPRFVGPAGRSHTLSEARVISVEQGDSMIISLAGKRENVRLIGIDVSARAPYRKQARELLRRLVKGKLVRVETDAVTRDPSNRLLAYVYADDVFVNLELVRHGQATISTTPPNVRHATKYLSAAQEARYRGRGMWGQNTSAISLIRCMHVANKPDTCS